MRNVGIFACVACGALLALAFTSSGLRAAQAVPDADAAAMQSMVHADWELQEKRLGRAQQSPEAIRAALARAARLLEDLRAPPPLGDLAAEAAQLARLNAQAGAIASLDEARRIDLYRRIRTFTRELALRNPLVSSRPILFMQRRRAVGVFVY
jgi:hypothetical protein